MVTVSVIIPVHNGAKTIAETIATVQQQTYPDWELIVVDDGSTDTTTAIITNLGEPRLQLFSWAQRGVCASRNQGARLAQGEFLAFLDADDLWSCDKLAAQLDCLSNPAVALAYSWTDYINEAGDWLFAGRHPQFSGSVYQQLFLGNFLENGSNALIRRSAFETVGGFDESLVGAEEWDLALRLAREYQFACVPQVQVWYRLGQTASSTQLERQRRECLEVIRRHCTPQVRSYLNQSLANLHRYLLFRGLQSHRIKPSLLAKYWLQSLIYQPLWLFQQPRLVVIAAIKVLLRLARLTIPKQAI